MRVDAKESKHVPSSPDTSNEEDRLRFERYRKMTPAEKLQVVAEMNHAVEIAALAELRQQYPDAPERELRLRLAARRYGRELVIKAFGWDPGEP